MILVIETESNLDSFMKIFQREIHPAAKKIFQFQFSTLIAKLF